MTTRRQFIASAPFGLAALAACEKAEPPSTPALQSRAAVQSGAVAGRPASLPVPSGGPELRYTPQHDELVYTFGGAPAKHRITSGTRIISWTEDCFDGAVKTTSDVPSKVMAGGHDNPQTGPFHLEGAVPGDTVAVHLIKVEPARNYAVSSFFPGFGHLVGSDRTAMLGPDFPETVWRYEVDIANGTATTSSRDGKHHWTVALAPFLGCLGLAPAGGEVRTTIVPSFFGGNMDCPEVRAGNTVFFGVNMPGALLSFGDGHYAMGDGEIIGAAIEGAMNVECVVELIKGRKTPIPRIENADEVMFVGNGRPLEDAARVAFKAMVGWVGEQSGMSEMDAYQLVSQLAKASIIQMVDPEYTVLVKLPKNAVVVTKTNDK